MEPTDEIVADEFSMVCATDADCPRPDLGQVCTEYYWDAVTDGSVFAKGYGCFNYKSDVCPGPDFATENYNYENTGWSYYIQYKCTSGESGAKALAVVGGAFLALLSATF